MKIIYLSLYLSIISSYLYAQTISQEIILGADRDKISVETNLHSLKKFFQNNREAKELEDRYHLRYKRITLGEYYAISISPIESIDSKQSLTILLKPLFPKLFFIDRDIKSSKIKKRYITSPSNGLDKDHLKEYVSKTHTWLEKWHVLIILLLLGSFFYYRKRAEIRDIKELQMTLSNDQDSIEDRINKG